MIGLKVRTEGLDGILAETLQKETAAVARPLVARAGERLMRRMREKLSTRGGPSRPGDPPALDTGALRDAIGRTGPFTEAGAITSAVGVGVGREAEARVRAQQGSDINVFDYADLHENGGFGGPGGTVRYPPRSFARAAEAEVEAQIVADWEAGL